MVPTSDYIFKKIFGQPGNEEITKGLISCILGRPIKSISLDQNPILESNRKDGKKSILDIKATLNSNIQCNLEMQIKYNSNITKRILFYWSRLYTQKLSKGNNYNKLKKTIVILITQFDFVKLQKIRKFHTEWKIRERKCKILIGKNI